MDDKNLLLLLGEALLRKKRATNFYEESLKNISSEHLQAVIKEMLSNENQHIETFNNLINKLAKNQEETKESQYNENEKDNLQDQVVSKEISNVYKKILDIKLPGLNEEMLNQQVLPEEEKIDSGVGSSVNQEELPNNNNEINKLIIKYRRPINIKLYKKP